MATVSGGLSSSSVGEGLLRWILFSVSFSTLPLAFNYLSGITRNQPIGYVSLVGRGELLIVSVAIAAAGAGDLFGRAELIHRNYRLFVVGMSFIIVCLASLWFADIANALREGQLIDQIVVARGSTIVFCASVVNSACCIVLSELRT
jgi:hypothetical protein